MPSRRQRRAKQWPASVLLNLGQLNPGPHWSLREGSTPFLKVVSVTLNVNDGVFTIAGNVTDVDWLAAFTQVARHWRHGRIVFHEIAFCWKYD